MSLPNRASIAPSGTFKLKPRGWGDLPHRRAVHPFPPKWWEYDGKRKLYPVYPTIAKEKDNAKGKD